MPEQASASKVITLPEHDDMLARLISVNDDPHAVERFYPIILKSAGQEKVSGGVVLILHLAVVDYTAGMSFFMADIVAMSIPSYVEALIDDEEVKAEALALIAEAEAAVWG